MEHGQLFSKTGEKMGYLPESSIWSGNVYEVADNDPVQGGVDGIDNIAARTLVNRTKWLRDHIGEIGGITPENFEED
jgi:hypothetical protein